MSSLFELVLNHNHIIELPNTIGLLRNLRTFYIDENDLSDLPVDVIEKQRIQFVRISFETI
jgi:Leucine-rich repeat (LRR) protein